jgi:hypothetical protein
MAETNQIEPAAREAKNKETKNKETKNSGAKTSQNTGRPKSIQGGPNKEPKTKTPPPEGSGVLFDHDM